MASVGEMPRLAHFVGGSWLAADDGGREIALVDPAREEVTRHYIAGDASIVDRAVASAQLALESFATTSMAERVALLQRWRGRLVAHAEVLAQIMSREIGAPIDFARRQQVGTAIGHLDATIAAAQTIAIEAPIAAGRPHDIIRYEAVGVVGVITAWNWPLNLMVLKVAGALAAGCTIVAKPSELSPSAAVVLARCLEEAGAPIGVFNLVLGDGETGRLIVEHPGIRLVSFTGSTATGQGIAAAAAKDGKRVVLELGGKSANILMPDCDLEIAIKQGVAHCFRNAGQSCNAASRMLVHESIYGRAVDLARVAALATAVDVPEREGGHIGPLVSQRQWERVQAYIRDGLDCGARLVCGGEGRPEHLTSGYFCRPTVFADVPAATRIAQEEIFGPVLAMMPFATEDEAVRLANGTRYGLAAFIQTRDAQCAARLARRLDAGTIQINGESRAPGAPFGGMKHSGQGRESGIWGIRAFQEVKSISGWRLD